MKTITSFSKNRYEELRKGILDGSLAEKWRKLKEKKESSLDRKEKSELRQIGALFNIFENDPNIFKKLNTMSWEELSIVEKDGAFNVIVR